MINYLLFDLDGTLTDSAEGIINSVKYTAGKLGLAEPDRDTLRKFIGPPLAESFSKLLGLPQDEIKHAISVYREYFSAVGIYENRLYPWTAELLVMLRAAGFKMAVATSKPEVYAGNIIARFQLEKYFDCICGIPLDNEKMTKSEVIAEALKKLGVSDRSEALMIGDRSYDVIGARQNGIACMGVTFGYGTREELLDAGAEYIGTEDTKALLELLLRLHGFTFETLPPSLAAVTSGR